MENDFENIRILFENAPVGIFLSCKSGRFVDMNEELARILGYSSKNEAISSIRSMAHDFYTTPDDRQKVLKEIIGKNQLSIFELKLQRKGGEIFEARMSVRPFQGEVFSEPHFIGIVEDTSEIKAIQHKYEISDKQYKALFELAADGILVGDHRGIIVDTNNSFLKLSGYLKDEIIGKPINFLFDEEVLKRTPLRYDLLQKGETIISDREMKKHDGSLVYIQMSTKMLPDGRYQALFRDISQSKEAELKLQKSEEKFRLLFHNMNSAFAYHRIITNRKGKPVNYEYIEVNSKFEELTGLKAADVVGKMVLDVIPTLEPVWIEKFGEVALTGKSIEYTDYVEALGKWYKAIAYSPKIGYFAVTFNDVTAEVESERAIKEREEMYRTIVELSPEGIITMSLNGTILTVNKSFLQLSGFGEESFLGKHFLSIPTLILQEIKTYTQLFSRIVKGDTQRPIEFKWKHKSGEVHFGEAHVSFIKKGSIRFIQGVIRDITESKKAQKLLVESEQRYNLAMQAVNEGIWDWNVDDNKVFFDSRYYTMAGYEPNEFPQNFEEWKKRIHPDDLPLCIETIQNHFLGKKEVFDIEFRFLRKEGNWMWIKGKGKVVERNKKGAVTRMIGTHTDITDRKHIELALKQSEERYRDLFESSPIGRLRTNLNGDFILVNKKLIEIFGYAEQDEFLNDLSRYGFNKYTSDIDTQESLKHLIEAGSGNGKISIIGNDGSVRIVKIYAEVHLNISKELEYIDCTFEDVTAEENLNQALKRNEILLSNIINSLPFDFFVKDVSGKVIIQNKVSFQFWGDINKLDTKVLEMNRSVDWEERKMKSLLGEAVDFESTITNSLGEKMVVRRIVVPIQVEEGETRGAIFMNIDISEQKRLKHEIERHLENLELTVKERTEELEATNEELTSINEELYYQRNELQETLQKLQNTQKQLVQSEKMASIGILTAGIAHEINNPINFISSGTIGLEMEIESLISAINEYAESYEGLSISEGNSLIEEIDKKYNVGKSMQNIPKLINSIRTGVERTTNIIKGLRIFSRLDDENKTLTNIDDLIGSALTILHNKYKNRIEVTTRFCERSEIYCYPGKLGQLFLNILMNAIQAIENEGTIDIETQYLEETNELVVTISDSGVGIPHEVQHRIFDPFFTTKPVGQGTGLGLAIVHGIVNDHNGSIKVQSQVGKGTTFTISLPKYSI